MQWPFLVAGVGESPSSVDLSSRNSFMEVGAGNAGWDQTCQVLQSWKESRLLGKHHAKAPSGRLGHPFMWSVVPGAMADAGGGEEGALPWGSLQ